MRRTRRWRLCALGCGLWLLLSGKAVQAQSFQGGVRGAVRDAQGVIPGASVVLINEATKVPRETTSNEVGEFRFPNVVPGTYSLEVSVSGYKKYERHGLTVATQQFVTQDTVLEVGTVEESITVTGASPLIDTSTASQGTVLDRAQLESLPTPGRNASLMAVTMPTVVSSGNTGFNRQNAQSGATSVSIGGGGVRANNYLLDGVPTTDMTNRTAVFVSIEGIEEMKVQVHTYDAEMGRTGGGVFNATAKSGTNSFHGSAFYRTQPTALVQQNFFLQGQPKSDQRPADSRLRPRRPDQEGSHLLLDVDGGRLGSSRSQLLGELSDHARAGGRLLADLRSHGPADRHLRSADHQDRSRDRPADSRSVSGQRHPDQPDQPGRTGHRQHHAEAHQRGDNQSPNYFNDNPTKDEALQWSAKMDHKFTDNLSLSALYVNAWTGEDGDCWYNSNLYACPMFRLGRKVHVVGANNNYVLNNSTVMSLRFGWNRFDDSFSLPNPFDPAELGFNQAYSMRCPGRSSPGSISATSA